MPWGGPKRTRPLYPDHFPEVVDSLDEPDVGGDPARFLCTGDSLLTRARIRGIADRATVRAWIGVANSLRQRGRLDDPDYWNLLGRLQERLQDLPEDPRDPVRVPVALDAIRAKRARDEDGHTSASAKLQSLRSDGGADKRECFRCGCETDPERLEPFELPDGETVEVCSSVCADRWADRVFITGGASA